MKNPHEDFHEVWWIWSDPQTPYGGLRIAHFHKTVTGVLIFMISDEMDDRRGVRIWEDIRKREGWFRVAKIAVPTGHDVRAVTRAVTR